MEGALLNLWKLYGSRLPVLPCIGEEKTGCDILFLGDGFPFDVGNPYRGSSVARNGIRCAKAIALGAFKRIKPGVASRCERPRPEGFSEALFQSFKMDTEQAWARPPQVMAFAGAKL